MPWQFTTQRRLLSSCTLKARGAFGAQGILSFFVRAAPETRQSRLFLFFPIFPLSLSLCASLRLVKRDPDVIRGLAFFGSPFQRDRLEIR